MKSFFKENWNLLKDVIWDKIPNFDFSNFYLNDIKEKANIIKNKIGEIWDLFNK
jgi:hypothetical protein